MPSCKLSIFILFDCIIQISEWAPSQPYWYNHDYLAWFQKEIVQGLFIQSCKHVYQSYFWKSNSIDLELSTERWLKKFRTEICIMNSYTDILQVKWMIFFNFKLQMYWDWTCLGIEPGALESLGRCCTHRTIWCSQRSIWHRLVFELVWSSHNKNHFLI